MGFRRNIGISIGLVALTLVLVNPGPRMAAGDGNHDEEKTIRIEATATSSFFTAPFSFVELAPGEAPANYAIYSGTSNRGKFTGQGVSQSAPTGQTCTLPDGSSGIELKLVGHVAVSRFERTGDLLFERGSPGSLVACFNLSNGTFHEEGTVTIVGGTGRFSGATGTETVVVDGALLAAPGSPPGSLGTFGFSTGTFKFEITVPK